MSLFNKITSKFQNFLRFEKLNPINSFDLEDNFEEINSKDNIVLFKKAIQEHEELKEVLWIALYHCLNTYGEKDEFLTVINKEFWYNC